jgi:serine phosphatase RsbU (regulator of sigma subunit)
VTLPGALGSVYAHRLPYHFLGHGTGTEHLLELLEYFMSIFENMRIRHLLVLALLPINIIIAGLYCGYLYREGKVAIIENVDNTLLAAAQGYRLFADPYHDRITDEHSLSEEEYLKALRNIAGFEERAGVEYAYSVIFYDGRIVFTSDCPSIKELDSNNCTPFFYIYDNAPKGLSKSLREKAVIYEEYSDEWGPHRSIFLPATSKTGKEYVIGMDFSLVTVQQRLKQILLYAVIVGILGFGLGLIPILLISRSITTPLTALSKTTEDIAKGNLDIALPPVKSGQELKRLSSAFDNMKFALKDYIRNLAETTAAKERIESELRVATDIQMSMLPRTFPPFPDRKEFDIFAMMEPAKEVGGDLYDFFLVQPDKLCFIIGDVCDKGVPAALFMAISKALLKTAGMAGLPPDAMLAQTNNILNPENDASMFITVFCAILDTNTGELKFANAGHPPPLLNSSVNGFQYMKLPKGFVVGPMPGVVYTCESATLRPGETVFLYTDGVTEAADSNRQLYSEARLQQVLTKLKDEDATGMVKGVREDITAFVSGSPQNDDITMLAIRFLGKSGGN